MSTTQSPPVRSKAKRFSASQIWISLIAALVLGLLSLVLIRTMGQVQGEEFSPTHFRTRTFSFYEIPLIHWQITPVHRSVSTPTAAVLLTQRQWIQAPPGDPAVWHVVSVRRGIEASQDADAALLVNQLRLRGDAGSNWRKWSLDHPERAAVLWPAIGKLAERELYILMPRLFEMTRRMEGVEPLKATLAAYLQQEYESLVRDMQAAGRDDLADALMAEAASDDLRGEVPSEVSDETQDDNPSNDET